MVSDIFWRDVENERLDYTDLTRQQGPASGDVACAHRYLKDEFEAVQRYLSMIDVPLRDRTLDDPDVPSSAHPDSPQM